MNLGGGRREEEGGGGAATGDDGFERRGGDLRGVSGCHGMTKCLAGFETCHFCRTDGEREYWITVSIRTILRTECE